MKDITPEQKKELFHENTILLGYRGSVAHNMYIPNTDPNSIDDIDLMGVYMAPVDYYIGTKRVKEVKEKFIDCWDVVSYEFKKFVSLLTKSNPNVLSLIWLEDNHYLKRHSYGNILIENRDLFVSKKLYDSFTGYAYGQMRRMEYNSNQGYMGEKRKALVEKYGYDCKNAAHCIRLLRMGIEFLSTGKLVVARPDAPRLLEVKRGLWTLERVKEEAERLFKLTDEAYVRSTLPAEPKYEEINTLVKNILLNYVNNRTTGMGYY